MVINQSVFHHLYFFDVYSSISSPRPVTTSDTVSRCLHCEAELGFLTIIGIILYFIMSINGCFIINKYGKKFLEVFIKNTLAF